MRTIYLTQPEYKQFQRRVAKLKTKGFNLNMSVAQPNKRKVNISVHEEYNCQELDTLCES